MKRRAGFTIVELIITITIMAILLTLAVVNLQSSQVGARDDERKTDVDNIARALETFYASGSDTTAQTGSYPSLNLMQDEATVRTTLRDLDPQSLRAPDLATSDPMSLIPATNATETTTGITPQPTTSQYVYQPLQTDGTLCTTNGQECRRFNLYYHLETDNTLYKVTSKNQ